jgi:hypothetical protein
MRDHIGYTTNSGSMFSKFTTLDVNGLPAGS